MYTTLAIIDVQEKFMAASSVIKRVVHQIELARRRHDGIVLVELGDPQSYDEIYRALRNYSGYVVTKKRHDDGSKEVLDAIRSNKYALDRIRLCGVNTCACVRSTAYGLIRSGFVRKVEIASDAVGCIHNEDVGCLTALNRLVKELKA